MKYRIIVTTSAPGFLTSRLSLRYWRVTPKEVADAQRRAARTYINARSPAPPAFLLSQEVAVTTAGGKPKGVPMGMPPIPPF